MTRSKQPRCPRCHVGGYRQETSMGDGRPAFVCTRCDHRWTCGKDGGEYAIKHTLEQRVAALANVIVDGDQHAQDLLGRVLDNPQASQGLIDWLATGQRPRAGRPAPKPRPKVRRGTGSY